MQVSKTTIQTPIEQSKGKIFIVNGLAELVESEGCSPHEAFRIMSRLKSEYFHTLCELQGVKNE